MIICRLQETSFQNSPLAEFGVGVLSFAGDPEDCRVGWAWRGRAGASSPSALGRAVPKRVTLKQAYIAVKTQNEMTTALAYFRMRVIGPIVSVHRMDMENRPVDPGSIYGSHRS